MLTWKWRPSDTLRAVVLAVSVISYGAYTFRMMYTQKIYEEYYRAKIPIAIELLEPVYVHAARTWGALPHDFFEPWAVAIYRISDDTASAAKNDGLNFFKGVQQWRELPAWFDSRHPLAQSRYTYRPWKPTPIPNGLIEEGSWGLCFPDDTPPEIWRMMASATQVGSFYTATDPLEGNLLIIPDLKIIIYCYTRF